MFVFACCCFASFADVSYDKTKAKADRFFENKEWASAAAVYGLMLHDSPQVADTYGRAIVSNEMLGDSIRAMQLLNQAMGYGVPLDSVLTNVQKYSFHIGEGYLYERFMQNAANENEWMRRPLDAYLLRYYAFRRNGVKMVEYAGRMLSGSPGNISFMAIQAEGYMIEGNFKKAVEIWNAIIDKDKNNYTALLNLANYYDITSDPTNALFYFRRAMELHPTPYVESRIKALEPPSNL